MLPRCSLSPSRCRRDPHRLRSWRRAIRHSRAAPAVPRRDRYDRGPGVRVHHRRLEAAAGEAPAGQAARQAAVADQRAITRRCVACGRAPSVLSGSLSRTGTVATHGASWPLHGAFANRLAGRADAPGGGGHTGADLAAAERAPDPGAGTSTPTLSHDGSAGLTNSNASSASNSPRAGASPHTGFSSGVTPSAGTASGTADGTTDTGATSPGSGKSAAQR